MFSYEWELEKVSAGKESLILLGRVDDKTKVLISVNPQNYKIKECIRIACQVAVMILSDSYLLVFSENTLTIFHRLQNKYF